MSSWVRLHFQHLRRWRDYAERVARAARDVLGDVRVYVIGGVAEGRVTVLSDIDILIVASRRLDPADRRRFRVEILERAINRYGLPWDAPVELHLISEGEEGEYLETGKYVEIEVG